MHALFDIYRVDVGGSAEWLDSVESYSVALLKIELIAVKAPGDYAIVNRQTGERTVLSCGLSVDGHHDHVSPVVHKMHPVVSKMRASIVDSATRLEKGRPPSTSNRRRNGGMA